MIRVVLCIAIFGCCTAVGFFFAAHLKERVKVLERLSQAVNLMWNTIRFENAMLQDALASSGKGAGDILFVKIAREMGKNMRGDALKIFEKEFAEVVKENTGYSTLTKRDAAVLRQLFAGLGKSDLSAQEMLFKHTGEQIMLQIEQAKKAEKEKGKMYRALGAVFGAMLGVLLI